MDSAAGLGDGSVINLITLFIPDQGVKGKER